MQRWDDCDDPLRDSTEPESGEIRGPRPTVEVPGLTILWHPDPDRVGERAVLDGLAAGQVASLSRLEPQFADPTIDGQPRPLELRRLSRRPVRLFLIDGDLAFRAEDSPTSVYIDGEVLAGERRLPAERLGMGIVCELAGQVALLVHRLDPLIEASPNLGFVGTSRAMSTLRQELLDAASLDVQVLLRGESGSGKELAARAIHQSSQRGDGPFVAVNLAAVPESLAAAELFGSLKGAFTGAEKRDGFFARAEGGTLFLDEIGDAPAAVQTMLLRALESGEIQPVGASRPTRVDVRLVMATDRDLRTAVAEGRFRAPLLYRLEACRIDLPPLRHRRDDVGRLLRHFLHQELAIVGSSDLLDRERSWLSAKIVARLTLHDWPGNVRELRNLARHLVTRCRGQQRVRLEDLPASFGQDAEVPTAVGAPRTATKPAPLPRRRPADVDEEELVEALRSSRWRPVAAARRLGIPRPSIYHLIRRSSRLRTAAALGRSEIEAAFARHDGDAAAIAAELEVSERGLRRRLGRLGLL